MLKTRERGTPQELQHRSAPDERIVAGLLPDDRRQPVHSTAALVLTAVFVLMLVGPNVLTEKEIRARMTAPPRRSWAVPGSLPELTDLDCFPWIRAQPLAGPDEFGRCHVRWPPKATESLARNGCVDSPLPQRRTSPVAA